MSAPKRKAPDARKKAAASGPGLAGKAMAGLGAFIGRYPRAIGGMAVFGVVYSFVAANALWYQHGHHPSPLLATRATSAEVALAEKQKLAENEGVTTFRIEREDASGDNTADSKTARVAPQASELVRSIQQALSDKGLYDGPTDGLAGPKTSAAIIFFEQTEGLAPSGEPSAEVLARLKGQNNDEIAVMVPADRYGDVTSSVKKPVDPVAGLIEANDSAPIAKAAPVSDNLVLKIQTGLHNISYDTVLPDGIYGEQTRAAIRSFEKHYNLPVTGEPSVAVLKKLKSIGAL